MDKLQAIQFFLTLAENRSFKATAAAFNATASTVSRSIKALENELDVTLFERTTRHVQLTESGAWYRDEISGPLRALKAADETVSAHAKEPIGTVRITASLGYGEMRLIPALTKFRALHPRIVCDLELTDRYVSLSGGTVDIALRALAEPPTDCVARCWTHRFVMVASPSYSAKHGLPRTVSELVDHAALGFRGAQGVCPWIAVRPNGETTPTARRFVLISNHGLELLRAAIAGEGLAFCLFGVSKAHWLMAVCKK